MSPNVYPNFMRAFLLTCVTIFITTVTANAQDTLYLDSKNQPVKKRKQADQFKVITKTDTGYVVEFLRKDMTLNLRMTYRDKELKTLHGYYTDYSGQAVYTEGRYQDGKPEGPWNYNYNGKRTAAIVYEGGKIVTANYFKPTGEPETDQTKIEQYPSFNGGMDAMRDYLTRTIKYPKSAKDNRISGNVLLEFTVMPNGQVADIDVIKPVNLEIDAEAVRVVRQMPRWNPGIQFARPVKVRYKMPIAFRL